MTTNVRNSKEFGDDDVLAEAMSALAEAMSVAGYIAALEARARGLDNEEKLRTAIDWLSAREVHPPASMLAPTGTEGTVEALARALLSGRRSQRP